MEEQIKDLTHASSEFPVIRVDDHADGVVRLSCNEAGFRELIAVCRELDNSTTPGAAKAVSSCLFVRDDPKNPWRQKMFGVGVALVPGLER